MSRWKAAGIHLALSALIGAAVFALLYFLWFPQPYFALAGGTYIIPIVIAVDVVIGPLLTLLVFKTGKPSLPFDLSVIAALQIGALVYALIVILDTRPIFLVARHDMLVLVSSNQVNDEDLARAPEAYQRRSWTGPISVGLTLPERGTPEHAHLTDEAMKGRDVEVFPQHYVPTEDVLPVLLGRARDLAELRFRDQAMLDRGLQAIGLTEDQLGYLPIQGKMGAQAMVVERASGRFLTVLPISPWPE